MAGAITSLALLSVADYALDWHTRGAMLQQNIQDKPLLRTLNATKKTFPGGKEKVTEPVKGNKMSSDNDFFKGVSGVDELLFTPNTLGDRAEFSWKQLHAGFAITHTDLLKDGISVTDSNTTSVASDAMQTRLTSLFDDALADFSESWAVAFQNMLWRDGSQDSKAIPGILSIILDDPTTGTVGTIAQSSTSWWRSRVNLSLSASADNQTLTRFLRNEIIQLRRYGGKPNKALCGSLWWDALVLEVQAKGVYTQTGFQGATDINVGTIKIDGVEFEYDPTLDDLGFSKRCFVIDTRRVRLRPIEGEDGKRYKPARPHQYLVLISSMLFSGALSCNQLNCHGVYAIA